MFQPVHCGLYFTEDQILQARVQQQIEPFRSAWAVLRQRRQLDLLALAQWQGLLYRLDEDVEAGRRTVDILEQDGPRLSTKGDFIEAAATAMTWAQCFELVRDHPAFSGQRAWLERFTEVIHIFDTSHDLLPVERLWLNTLHLIAGVVLEDSAGFERAVDVVKEIVRHEIHPEGYIRLAVTGPKGDSLRRMLLAAQALILSAEAASHVGEDLWAFNERRVSVLTPVPYLLYYYYYPEKWRWDAEGAFLQSEGVQALYQRHAGLWEMAQRQVWSKDRQTLLNAIRPVYDLWGGGLVTLTHGAAAPRRKRFGLF